MRPSPSDVLDARPCARGRAGIELLPPVRLRSTRGGLDEALLRAPRRRGSRRAVYRRRADRHAQARHHRRQRQPVHHLGLQVQGSGRGEERWPHQGEVYPAGQLAKNEIVQLEGMQLGTVDVGAISLPSIGGKFDPKMLATDVPFLYTGREHVWKVMDGPIGKEM